MALGDSVDRRARAQVRDIEGAAEDWRLLAFYSWETDEQQMVAGSETAATLERLAKAQQTQLEQ